MYKKKAVVFLRVALIVIMTSVMVIWVVGPGPVHVPGLIIDARPCIVRCLLKKKKNKRSDSSKANIVLPKCRPKKRKFVVMCMVERLDE